MFAVPKGTQPWLAGQASNEVKVYDIKLQIIYMFSLNNQPFQLLTLV